MGPKTLVALDTDHIKQYVFATNKLKEIRGSSSLLDYLNRREMIKLVGEYKATPVYTNGGSGLFLVEDNEERAREFGRAIQRSYIEKTRGGATISFAMQKIPGDIDDVWHDERVHPYMGLLHYRLLQEKGTPHQEIEALPSHPFMSPCDACGVRYAEGKYKGESSDPDDQERRYCSVCLEKREEDNTVRKSIRATIKEQRKEEPESESKERSYIWETIIKLLLKESYWLPDHTDRPSDFNKLQGLSGGKDYMALIYADANHMGAAMDDLKSLKKRKDTADLVDNAIYAAMSRAIAKHLAVVPGEHKNEYMFPFDILMIGGDDVMVVTPANVAIDVGLTLARTFHEQTKINDIRSEKNGYSLSIGIVLAPVKYPFGLLQDLAESALKFAKKAATKNPPETKFGNTIINFMTVTGSSSLNFNKVYDGLHEKQGMVHGQDTQFYATLRPYTVEGLTELLDMIRKGKQLGLGRTKLHQVREAVLRMNLTTSVSEGVAVLNNWKTRQREFVMEEFYKLAERYQEKHRDVEKPATLFPRVTFPWFADGPDTYRTSLLDFVELYDFVAQEEVEDAK